MYICKVIVYFVFDIMFNQASHIYLCFYSPANKDLRGIQKIPCLLDVFLNVL